MEQPDSISGQQDVELLGRIAGRDLQAFSCFYDRFGGILFSVAVAILKDTSQAEEVIQDVFLQIWERAGVYDRQLGKPLSWAVALTRNKAIDRLRSTQRRSRLVAELSEESDEFPSDDTNAAGKIIGNETAAMVRNALNHLPAEQRKAIELAFLGGLTQTEIAAELKLPLGTVKARIRRGMLQMRDALKGLC